jgi:methionyl-tRNA synthetase
VCQAPDQEEFSHQMSHVIGKNIAKFHLLYRPAMLMSAGLPLPRWEVLNGFLTIDGQKISKSLGNAISPLDVIEKTDRDALVLYYFYDLKIGSDGDFSLTRFHDMYESMLVGGRGNLINRVVTMSDKNNIENATFSIDQRNKMQESVKELGIENNPLLHMIHDGRNDKRFEDLITI